MNEKRDVGCLLKIYIFIFSHSKIFKSKNNLAKHSKRIVWIKTFASRLVYIILLYFLSEYTCNQISVYERENDSINVKPF